MICLCVFSVYVFSVWHTHVYHGVLSQSSVIRYLDCFQFCAVINNTVLNSFMGEVSCFLEFHLRKKFESGSWHHLVEWC